MDLGFVDMRYIVSILITLDKNDTGPFGSSGSTQMTRRMSQDWKCGSRSTPTTPGFVVLNRTYTYDLTEGRIPYCYSPNPRPRSL